MLPAGVTPPEPGASSAAAAQAEEQPRLKAVSAASAPVGAAAGPKPVWRSLPTMTPGAMAAAAYGSAVAPPVYRSLRVVRPPAAAQRPHGGDFRSDSAVGMYGQQAGVPAAPSYRGASAMHMPGVRQAAFGGHPVNIKNDPRYAVNGADGSLVFIGAMNPKNEANKSAAAAAGPAKTAAQQQGQQPQQELTQAPILPLVFQRSAKHFVVSGISLADLSKHMVAVAQQQEAELVIKPQKATMKLSKLAPPTAPDGGCSVVVFKIRVFTLQADAGQYLMDFTHRKGSRVVACELYREVVAKLRGVNAIQTPEHDHLLAAGGGARPCKVYTVPSFRRPAGDGAPVAVEPAVAAATVAPLLAAAASPCFDQQRASCQLLAKLTASKRAAAAAAASAANAMQVEEEEEEEDSSDYMASAIVGAMFDDAAKDAVCTLLACLCDEQPPADGGGGAGVPAVPRPRVHEDVRRCIVSTVANMALMEQAGLVPGVPKPAPGAPSALRRLLDAAKALVPVQQALPKGANPVHPGTYSSAAARDALAAAAK